MSVAEFWGLSMGEVIDCMESHERRERGRMRQELTNKHFLAMDMAQHVSLMFGKDDNQKPMELWDYFPELFRQEKEQTEQKRKEQTLAIYKAQLSDFAYRHNHGHKKAGGEEP